MVAALVSTSDPRWSDQGLFHSREVYEFPFQLF